MARYRRRPSSQKHSAPPGSTTPIRPLAMNPAAAATYMAVSDQASGRICSRRNTASAPAMTVMLIRAATSMSRLA